MIASTTILINVIFTLLSFIIGNSQIPQSVKDRAVYLVQHTAALQADAPIANPIGKGQVDNGTSTDPIFGGAPVVAPISTSTPILPPIQVIPCRNSKDAGCTKVIKPNIDR